MITMHTFETGRCDALVEGLRAEFGALQAERIIEAEAADFLWEARVQERYLGQHLDAFLDEETATEDLSRIAFLSLLDGCWHAGICLVDGEGGVVGLSWNRGFARFDNAELEFEKAR
jgi:hypothetical protein